MRTVVTISTSFMIAAGLKKCRPMTRSGRSVTIAHSMIGSDEVVVDSTVLGLQDRRQLGEQLALDLEVLGDGLDDEVGRGEVGELRGRA